MEPEKAYLDQLSLGRFLRERLDQDIVFDQVAPEIHNRLRPDYLSKRHKLIVEFDGDQHYRRAKQIISDAKKDRLFETGGYTVIRIPYFVQLTEPVIRLLFGKLVADRTPFKNFAHGFIDGRVIFPADFCELGVKRFQDDLNRFAIIREDIEDSLRAACKKKTGV